MANKAVFCIASKQAQATRIADQLKVAGFSANDISVLYPDQTGNRTLGHEENSKAPEGAAAGAGTGGLLGGGLGWLIGIGSLAIPGVGPFIAAGPIMAALAGMAIGAAAGGMAGTLVGLGIPEYEAKRYEGRLRSGNILISVHTEDRSDVNRVKQIFQSEGAEDISYTGETAVRPADGVAAASVA